MIHETKKGARRFLSILLALTCLVLSVSVVPPVMAKADIVRPTQVQNVSEALVASGKVSVTWDAARYQEWDSNPPTGYTVYLKKGAGKYNSVKNTSKTSCTIKNLSVGSKYYLKVKAYNKFGRKKYYGQSSVVLKFTVNDWEYLSSLVEPYGLPGWNNENSDNVTYNNYSEYFMMGGEKNYNGYAYTTDANGDNNGHPFSMNLKGKYSRITFNLGLLDKSYDRDVTFYIYGDDQLLQTITRAKSDLPDQVSIGTNDIYKFQIRTEFEGNGYDTIKVGISDVKAYY